MTKIPVIIDCDPGIDDVMALLLAFASDELDYYIGVASAKGDSEKFEALAVEAGTLAVFEAKGPFPEILQSVWGRIYAEWFPSSGYEAVDGPEILWNESPDTSRPDYRSEIWIPVTKK